jgi:hypothetical protein
LPWDESKYEVQNRRIVGGEQLELSELFRVPAGPGYAAFVHFLEGCTFRKTEDPYKVHRYIDLIRV